MTPAPYLNVPLLPSEAEEIVEQQEAEVEAILNRCEGLAYVLHLNLETRKSPSIDNRKFLNELEDQLIKLIKSVHHNLR
jgi:hypothetical protein